MFRQLSPGKSEHQGHARHHQPNAHQRRPGKPQPMQRGRAHQIAQNTAAVPWQMVFQPVQAGPLHAGARGQQNHQAQPKNPSTVPPRQGHGTGLFGRSISQPARQNHQPRTPGSGPTPPSRVAQPKIGQIGQQSAATPHPVAHALAIAGCRPGRVRDLVTHQRQQTQEQQGAAQQQHDLLRKTAPKSGRRFHLP